jgi:SAM-dependent methyltransferase
MPTEAHDGVSDWARRAATLYDGQYARRYRRRDDEIEELPSNRDLVQWLGAVCDRFRDPIDVLDLGCGTGRYFWGLRGAASIVGLDASAPMLDEARTPLHGERLKDLSMMLVRGDLMTHQFAPASFDLVYSIGVLAEHVPLNRALVDRVQTWLRPGGRFAFTTVHPLSASVPRTLPRRMAAAGLAVLPAGLTGALHRRFVAGGLYGDERWIAGVLDEGFTIESLERFQSDVHLHARCVALRRA